MKDKFLIDSKDNEFLKRETDIILLIKTTAVLILLVVVLMLSNIDISIYNEMNINIQQNNIHVSDIKKYKYE